MTVEWIERDNKRFQILYGFGRIQRTKVLFYSLLHDACKRAQIANPDITEKELIAKASPQEILEYNQKLGVELAKLVLNDAPDWDKTKVSVEEYVDSYLPEDVGLEIANRMRDVVAGNTLTPDEKKT